MPTIITSDKPDRIGRAFLPLSEIPATRQEYIGAAFEQSEVESPAASMGRAEEMREAAGLSPAQLPEPNEVYEGLQQFEPVEERDRGPMLTPQQVQERYGDLGISAEEDEPESLVLWKVARKREENQRRSIMERSPGTFTSLLGIGAAFLAQAKDPINIASAFVPVVGPTRLAAWTARSGRTAALARQGAIEGFVGATLVEPIVLAQARAEQADYEFGDALLNVFFGTALGGGLHVGVGKLSDRAVRFRGGQTVSQRIDALPVESRDRLLRSSIAALAEGREVNIQTLLDIEEIANFARGARQAEIDAARALQLEDIEALRNLERRGLAAAPEADRFDLGGLTRGRYRNYSRLSPEDRRQVEGVIAEVEQSQPGSLTFVEAGPGQGGSPEVRGATRSTFPEFFQRINRESIESQRARRRGEDVAAVSNITKSKVTRAGDKLLRGEPLGVEEGRIAAELVGEARARREANARDILNMRADREDAVRQELEAIARREEGEDTISVDRNAAEEAKVMTDQKHSPRTRSEGVTQAEEELNDALERLAANENAIGAEQGALAEFPELDADIKRAKELEEELQAGAACMARQVG